MRHTPRLRLLPRALPPLASELVLARGGSGRLLNVYLLGDVVIDSGLRWSRRLLRAQLRGRRVSTHVLAHAHFDHAIAEESPSAELTARQLLVDRSALELNAFDDAVRVLRDRARLLELAAEYDMHPAYKPEWRQFPAIERATPLRS